MKLYRESRIKLLYCFDIPIILLKDDIWLVMISDLEKEKCTNDGGIILNRKYFDDADM